MQTQMAENLCRRKKNSPMMPSNYKLLLSSSILFLLSYKFVLFCIQACLLFSVQYSEYFPWSSNIFITITLNFCVVRVNTCLSEVIRIQIIENQRWLSADSSPKPHHSPRNQRLGGPVCLFPHFVSIGIYQLNRYTYIFLFHKRKFSEYYLMLSNTAISFLFTAT